MTMLFQRTEYAFQCGSHVTVIIGVTSSRMVEGEHPACQRGIGHDIRAVQYHHVANA